MAPVPPTMSDNPVTIRELKDYAETLARETRQIAENLSRDTEAWRIGLENKISMVELKVENRFGLVENRLSRLEVKMNIIAFLAGVGATAGIADILRMIIH